MRKPRCWPWVALLFACNTTSAFPTLPGGGGGGGHGGTGSDVGVDAAAGPDANVISAQACSLTDLRVWNTCANGGAGGLLVTLGDGSAITGDDGTFTLPAQSGTNLVWTISGSGFLTTQMAYVPSIVEIPIVTQALLTPIEADSGVTDLDDGQVFVAITSSDAPVLNEVGKSTPIANQTFYDDVTDDTWGQIETESHGIVWFSGVTAGFANIEVQPASFVGSDGSGSGYGVATGVPVTNGQLTFVELVVPG
jgi:hypothetical protein